MPTPLQCQKDAFRLPADLHYLNCAYMGPLPRAAEEAGIRALRLKRVPTAIGPDDFFRDSDEVRKLFGGLVNAPDPTRVAIHPSASYGVATAARNLPLAEGQEVVVVGEQFPGNVYAWRRRAEETGARIRTVPRPSGPAVGARWNQDLLEAIGPATGIVAVPTVHWTDGTRFDLPAVGARARDVGAALLVDGTQSVGAVPFDVREVQPDALVVAAYKWLLGPYALAFAWLGPRFDDGVPLEETWIGRRGSEDFKGLVEYTDEYQPGAVRYDVGERSNFALLPVAAAALRLLRGWGTDGISEYTGRISAPLIRRAEELGFGVEEADFRSPHLFGLRMPAGLELGRVRAALDERGVSVSLRGASLRISPNVYNDQRDVDALIRALEDVSS
ncbi:MAG: aminotransferase class V-fold PLP-dependent enzyme [Gemmatimonadota bacterium]